MTDTTAAAATPARVTIDDVRSAIEGTDPNQTNASKVRGLLGNRGSFETIQKHLNVLRQEVADAAAPPTSADQAPAMPAEAAQAMWVTAWNAAQVQTLRRSEKLAAERDAALLQLETMSEDITVLTVSSDELAGQLDQAAHAIATVKAAHLADVDRLTADLAAAALAHAELTQELHSTGANLEKARIDAEHAAEMANSGRELMRQELARLTDQIGELKAVIYKRVDTAPTDAADSKPAKTAKG